MRKIININFAVTVAIKNTCRIYASFGRYIARMPKHFLRQVSYFMIIQMYMLSSRIYRQMRLRLPQRPLRWHAKNFF